MRLKSKTVVGLVAGCAALAFSAAPASAAPLTVKTDAGTTCTVNADYTLGAGLLVRPIDFKGTIGCSPANSANVPTWTGVPEGCRLSEDGSVSCTSFSAKFTTN